MRRLLHVPLLFLPLLLAGCEYVGLLRPSVLKQLNPRVVRMVDYLPRVDDPNEAMVARLFAHGGLSHAKRGADGVYHDEVRVPPNEFIWTPAIVVMDSAGELDLKVSNDDQTLHMMLAPSMEGRRLVHLPAHRAGGMRIRLDQPGLYWFGCPVSDHAGRGMLGLVIVEGKVPPEARLDRPRLPQP
jgi:PQQ system protein